MVNIMVNLINLANKCNHLLNIFQECGIVAQYTMLGTPKQNSVVERNYTLKDMIKNMIKGCNLPGYLWDKLLKIAIYILNRVSSKALLKTPFELWIGRNISINYFHVQDCPIKVKIYNLSKNKSKARTTHCYFIDYQIILKDTDSTILDRDTKIVESINTSFMESDMDD